MVRPYYVDEITAISERELRPIAETVEPPACLLGGWAVFHRVNSRFQQEYGRRFIGSRDIDIGFHVNPDWDADDLHESPVGEAVQRVQKIGYMPLSFRFVRHFERSTGEALTEDEARSLPPHQLFDLYLDLIMDTTDLDTFQEVLGFRPPAEELLENVFEGGAATSLDEFVPWELPESWLIADPDLLAAMKIRSIPYRNRDQKRVKDAADLHALMWYTKGYREMRSAVRSWVGEEDLELAIDSLDDDVYRAAADLLEVDVAFVRESIEQL